MNYTEIKQAAIDYSDRYDSDTSSIIDTMIKIVESRVNRALRTRKMTVRAQLTLSVADQRYIGLPSDFRGQRDIQVAATGGNHTLRYINPEQMNGFSNVTTDLIYYTIINDQLQVTPPQDIGEIIEIIYYQEVSNLNSGAPNNWLSDGYSDCYIFGLMAEISAYAKDAEAFTIWDGRFEKTVGEIEFEDQKDRWSGTPMQVRVG